MKRHAWTAAVVLACICTTLAAMLWPREGSVASSAIATPQAPARRCAAHPPAVLRGLREGGQRLVVVVKAFQPPKARGGPLVVWLLSPAGKRHELTRFAVHPLRAFTAQEPDRAQRFQVSLAEVAHLVEDGKPLCVEVGFDNSGSPPEGGMAEIDIEWQKVP